MRPLASLSLVSSWDREVCLSASHSLSPLAKIRRCFNHHQYWLWCQTMGGGELSHYRYVSLNILRHTYHALGVAERRNYTRCDAIAIGSEEMVIVDIPMQLIRSNAECFLNQLELRQRQQYHMTQRRFFNLVVVHSVFCTLLLSSWWSTSR